MKFGLRSGFLCAWGDKETPVTEQEERTLLSVDCGGGYNTEASTSSNSCNCALK